MVPLTSTSLTPEARVTCLTGGLPIKLTSTRCAGSVSVMLLTLGTTRSAEIGGITERLPIEPACHP